MAKITLNDLSNLQNENTAVTKINQNNSILETALENTLSRDGTLPNQMEADFDMNSNDILNANDVQSSSVHTNHLYVNGGEVISNLSNILDKQMFANISGKEFPPAGVYLRDFLDYAVSDEVGTLLSRTSSGWQGVPAGVAGDVLTSQGPGNELKYIHITGGGDMLSGNNGLDFADLVAARSNLRIFPFVKTRSDLKLFDVNNGYAYLSETGREGLFVWKTGNYASQVAVDTSEGVYIKANSTPDYSGAWVRANAEILNVKWFGAVGDGSTNDRNAAQAAFNLINAGYFKSIKFPSNHNFKIVNATGNGTTLEDKRADAVLNNTLYPITCTASNVDVHVEGTITGTSALGDLFVFTGNYIRVFGPGIVTNSSGNYLVTNSTDPVLQWHPSLLHFQGDWNLVTQLTVQNQPTIGVWMDCNYSITTNCRFEGGPTLHDTGGGTVLFAYMSGAFSIPKVGHVCSHNTFGRSYPANGAAYDGVFNTAAFSIISNNVMINFLEHGIYGYGDNCVIHGNKIDNSAADPESAAGLQYFADNVIISDNTITGYKSTIGTMKMSYSSIIGNRCSAITVSTYPDPATQCTQLLIANNNLNCTIEGFYPIMVDLTLAFNDITITGNKCSGGVGSGGTYRSGIYVRSLDSSPGRNLTITNNTVRDCDAPSIIVSKVTDFTIENNYLINGCSASDSTAIRGDNNTHGTIRNNTCVDTRGTAVIDTILYMPSLDTNSSIRAYGNNLINPKSASTPICVVPSNGERRGNTINSSPVLITFPTQNAISWDVTAPCCRAGGGAMIITNPLDGIALEVQAGTHAIFGSPDAGKVTMSTRDGVATGTVGGNWLIEVIQ